MNYMTCPECDGEGGDHWCAEDICCCLNPENNILCSTCCGEGDVEDPETVAMMEAVK